MSIFRVQLQNQGQGLLDIDPTTGVPFTTSKQRSVYVMGPGKINRELKDGVTFVDCNYWKRFAYPQVPYEQAFISVVSDDGSVYSDIAAENTFGVGGTYTLSTSFSTTNQIDFVNTYGAAAQFLQITNNDAAISITVQLNGNANLSFTLKAGVTQVFNNNDLAITLIQMKSASGTPTATVIASVLSTPKS